MPEWIADVGQDLKVEKYVTNFDPLHRLVDLSPLWLLGMVIGVGFAAIYLSYAWLSLLATRRVLPSLGIGALIEKRPLAHGQVRKEVAASLSSIGHLCRFRRVDGVCRAA